MRPRSLLPLLLLLLTFTAVDAVAQPYGLDAPTPVAPFLDGVFPTTAPTGSVNWTVEDAFPALVGTPDTILVISSNPADDRLYLGSRDGEIVSIPNDPAATAVVPFMDLRDRVAVMWDAGFMGLVFHPDFGQVGSPNEFTFYTYLSSYCPTDADGDDIDFSACNPSYPTGSLKGYFNTWLRLSKWTAYWDSVEGVWKGDATSEEPLINIRLYNNSHRGGGPSFGTDGLLYLAIGDQFRYNTAQEITNTLEGGVLRLQVDVIEDGLGGWTCPAGSHMPRRLFRDVTGNVDEMSGRLYCIPDDNPWLDINGSVMEEYYSIGHRNPHRIAVDPVTGLLWLGEVGENTREEVNVIDTGGRNFGWPFREGKIAGPRAPPTTIIGLLTDPVIDFDRTEANSVIGGYVYRGTKFPELVGRYLAGDWVTKNVWAIDLDVPTMTATKEFLTTFDPGGLATFGQANDGEVFLGSVVPGVGTQQLARVGAGVPDPPPFLSQLGAFTDLTTLQLHPAAVPFEPLTFWSDGAEKGRWLFLPNDGTHDQIDEQILFSETGNWDFPAGSVLMKHFELPVDEADPALTVRLETRFLVRGTDLDWYGVTYRWDPDQLDAALLTTGETGDYTVQTSGGPVQQTWVFPSRSDCLTCHNTGVGGPAGPRTHGLNRDVEYPATGRSDNQLRTWNHLGMFTPALVEPDIPTYLSAAAVDDATASLEFRARSYLDTNCSYCHRPETGNRAAFDARLSTPLEDQFLIWGGVIDPKGLTDPHLVTPGDPSTSLVHYRAAALGADAMPPLAKNVVDDDGVALLAEWIQRIDPGYPQAGLRYEYFEETGLGALPDFDLLTPVKTGALPSFDLSLRDRDDDFAFRFEGVVDVPSAGDWTFYTSSDEGSQLFVDDVLIVDNDGLHTNTEVSGLVNLSAGFHTIRVTYFEATGAEVLNVSWEGPGTAKQAVASNLLFQQVPVPITNDPPTLTDPGDQLNDIGDVVSLALAANDTDGDPLYYSASGLPAGLAIDSASGLIDGTLGAGSFGVHAVTVGVSDGPDTAFESLDWMVNDTSAPSVTLDAPSDGVTVEGIVAVAATASDDDGVAGVQFLLDGAPLGAEDTEAPYALSWDTTGSPNGAYSVVAEARDAAGNVAQSSAALVTVDNPLSGPVAAWAFEDGSGSVAADATGRGHDGAITGAAWTASGRYGAGLVFDGVDDVVVVPDADDLDMTHGELTLSAWVNPSVTSSTWAAILQKEVDTYVLHASSPSSSRPVGGGTIDGSCCPLVYAPASDVLPVGTWSHIALTYDGAQLVYYVDGVAVASEPTTGPIDASSTPLRLGNNTYANEAFAGTIDEVRVYERALSEAEIAADMSMPLPPPVPDVTPPTVALTAPADGSTLIGVVSVDATASDDGILAGVQFLLDGLPLGVEDTLAPYTLSWNTYAELNGAHVLTAEARDAAGNTAESAAIGVTIDNPPDTTAPLVAISSPADGATVSGLLTISATASDDVGVAGVQFLLDGADLGTEDTTPPFAFDWNTLALADGSYTLTARARDGAGNVAVSADAVVTVDNTTLAPVAAWAFAEGIGALALDSTGNGHDGALSGATWTPSGRYGSGIAFDGVDDVVVVPDSDELDMPTGQFTLSAWVYPTALGPKWSIVMQKEVDAFHLLAGTPSNERPAGGGTLGGVCCTLVYAPTSEVLPLDAWSHIGVTYDGSQLAYYIDGVEVATALAAGAVEANGSPLRIGNNTYPNESFTGTIDEVRVYDRALTEAEMQTDMATPVAPATPDTTPPVVSVTAPADGATLTGQVSVEATATDDVAVLGVQFLLDGSPLGAEDTTEPYAISWNTFAASDGPHTLSATARDAGTNVGTAADVGVTVSHPPDGTAPTVSITQPTVGATVSGLTPLEADASDNVGVAGVQFRVDGLPVGAEDTDAPYALSWDSTSVADGAHLVSAEVRDAAGNTAVAADVSFSVDNSTLSPVAAWRFEEGAGALAMDATGRGHTGAVLGSTWTPAGRHGGGLSFDGLDDVVEVAERDDLELAGGEMTLSAWVWPTVIDSSWSPVMQKEVDGYHLLAGTPSGGKPAGGGTIGGVCCPLVYGPSSSVLPTDAWTHLAVTYDGAQLVLYVDGVARATEPATGPILGTNAPLRIGNNTYANEAFEGILDEVHLYDRALDSSEILRDRDEIYVPEPSAYLGMAACLGTLGLLHRVRLRARGRRPF